MTLWEGGKIRKFYLSFIFLLPALGTDKLFSKTSNFTGVDQRNRNVSPGSFIPYRFKVLVVC